MDNVHQRLGKCPQPTAHPLSRTITKLFLAFTQNFLHTRKWKSIFLFLNPISSGAESFLAGTHSCRIEVNGIEELYKELKEKNVLHNEKTEMETTYYGTREFATLDLYGNLLTFYESFE